MAEQRTIASSTQGTNIADLLERILDKGIVVSGDIRVKIVDIELLTLEIRLVVCSVDKAIDMGIDWWKDNPVFTGRESEQLSEDRYAQLEQRLQQLEGRVETTK